MTANAWGEEPSRSRRFQVGRVRAAITVNADGTYYVSAGLFRNAGCDHCDLVTMRFADRLVTVDDAFAWVKMATELHPAVWDEAVQP